MKRRAFLSFALISIASLSACTRSAYDSYWKTVENGITTVPHVSEVTTIFSNAPTGHFFSQYSWDEKGPVMWNTEVVFGGRYELTYQVPVSVDYSRRVVLGTNGPPKFYLSEISQTDGSASSYERGWILDETHWEKVVAAKGDFSVVGILLNTNLPPVANWDAYVQMHRANWTNWIGKRPAF